MDVPKILTELRAEKGIYQKELAASLKVSIGTVSNYEKGTHAPDLDMLCKLADYYGVTTDFLLGRTHYRYAPQALSRPLSKDYTVADLVNTTLELDKRDLHSVLDFISLLKMRKEIQQAKEQDTLS